MTNYNYRRYEGAPYKEKKRLSPEPPSKLLPRKQGPSPRPPKKVKNLYSLAPKGPWRRWYLPAYDKYDPVNPHVGHRVGSYSLYSAGEHVIRRLKANLMEDTTLKIYWVEEQATHAQLSPVFYSFEGITNWLLYLGLEKGWLTIESFWMREYTFGGKVVPKRHGIKFNKW